MSGVAIHRGKARDIYADDDQHLLLVATDRVSAFDRAIAEIPDKGTVLNQLSAWWFNKTKPIIANHFVDLVSANSMRVIKCQVIPVEVVVRGYLTGSTSTSVWTLYQEGQREFFSTTLPDGLQKNAPLSGPILTPTSKSAVHDQPLTPEQVNKLVDPKLWQEIATAALDLFTFGQQVAFERDLILVDTKYEFGLDTNGKLLLIDECHTPDSSRFWSVVDYQEKFAKNLQPNQYDKEALRLWYREHCDPYHDEVLPKAPAELIAAMAGKYRELYRQLTGSVIT